MLKPAFSIALAVLFSFCTAASAADIVDEFDGMAVDPETWNTCQVDEQRLDILSETVAGETRRFLRNVVAEDRANQETCTRAGLDGTMAMRALAVPSGEAEDEEASDGSDLGPSLVEPGTAGGRLDLADACPVGGEYQRSELRFQKRPDLVHDLHDPHWYAIRFRVGGDIPRCGSARWIVAQWKEPNGDSPFLGLRFDNGVLHVSMQNDHCRCVVAKAGGDPDRMSMRALGGNLAPDTLALSETVPLACALTNLPEGAPQQACTPADLTVSTPGGGVPAFLPDPTKGWVDMAFHVREGSDAEGRVDIYADGRFIARVDGRIGYSDARPGNVKFKFGHYRSWVPGRSWLDVDRLCVSKDAAKCLAGVAVVP